jgi:hypothetical protein
MAYRCVVWCVRGAAGLDWPFTRSLSPHIRSLLTLSGGRGGKGTSVGREHILTREIILIRELILRQRTSVGREHILTREIILIRELILRQRTSVGRASSGKALQVVVT